jgi:hypothetical protein
LIATIPDYWTIVDVHFYGQITRFPLIFTDGSGNASYAVDNTAAPALGKIVAGATWKWQFWFRDPMGGGSAFNTSDGLSVTYCP